MMRIVGVDASLRSTGIAILTADDSTADLFTYVIPSSSKKSAFSRQMSIVKAFVKNIQEGDLVVFEDFAQAGRFQPSSDLMIRVELLGMLKAMAMARSRVKFLQITPRQLKSFVAEYGDAKKKDLVRAMQEKWGLDIPQNDECDAAGLAIFGWAAKLMGAEHPVYFCTVNSSRIRFSEKQIRVVKNFCNLNGKTLAIEEQKS
jgi:Holliday junction resolvasome RuvABC endonuclease subunit